MTAEELLRNQLGGLMLQVLALTAENHQLKLEKAQRESATDHTQSPA
jgi:hypothetical protein